MTATGRARKLRDPYVGPRPFRRGEQLYGREREALKLADLLIAGRVVLLHSPSGAGKTSLIQAGLVPQLETQDFHVLPSIRVSMEPPPLPRLDGFNRYVFSAISSLEARPPGGRQRPLEDLARMSLSEYLNQLAAEDERDQVLIFDQFEEILTLDPIDWDGQEVFFQQVGAALADREYDRWALFSMREEYIAGLDPYVRWIPTHLEVTFRLNFLDHRAALRAVQQPAMNAGTEFSLAAAERLVDDLRMISLSRSPGQDPEKRLSPYVEPLQLQLVCRRLWSGLGADTAEIQAIEPSDLERWRDIDDVLAAYYGDTVRAIAAATEVTERALRDWLESLISESRFRQQTMSGPEPGGEIAWRALQRLEAAYLIRGEQRRGTTWYELAHDRFIRPILMSNNTWRLAHLAGWQAAADTWARSGRNPSLLLHGPELRQAQQSARTADMTELERQFLKESARMERQTSRTHSAIGVLGLVALVELIAIILLLVQLMRS
jgi:hypothetical protein